VLFQSLLQFSFFLLFSFKRVDCSSFLLAIRGFGSSRSSPRSSRIPRRPRLSPELRPAMNLAAVGT
jgi:hypothetical protein